MKAKTNKITKRLYNGEVVIDFYPDSHQYRKEGKRLTGVTTPLGLLSPTDVLMKWAVNEAIEVLYPFALSGTPITPEDLAIAKNAHTEAKNKAGSIGDLVHAWAEEYAHGLNPAIPEDEKVANGVLGFLRWVNDNGIKFVANERVVYSRKYDYVGTMDVIFTLESENHEILHAGDFKTSSGIYSSAVMQVVAYREAYLEENPNAKFGDSYIMRFAKEDKNGTLGGDFELVRIPTVDHEEIYEGFLACLKAYRVNNNLNKLLKK